MRNIVLLLSVLVLSYVGARLFGAELSLAGRISIAAVFCLTASAHFVQPAEMLEMIPPWVPARSLVVLLSGLLEFAFAIGILLTATSRLTALAAIVFLCAAAPLNVYSAFRRVRFGGHAAGPGYLLVRLPLQLVLIGWIWWFGLQKNV